MPVITKTNQLLYCVTRSRSSDFRNRVSFFRFQNNKNSSFKNKEVINHSLNYTCFIYPLDLYFNLTSLHKNSLILERRTFLPSACLEKGVRPAPLSCNSHLSPFLLTISPKYLQVKLMLLPRRECILIMIMRVSLHKIDHKVFFIVIKCNERALNCKCNLHGCSISELTRKVTKLMSTITMSCCF